MTYSQPVNTESEGGFHKVSMADARQRLPELTKSVATGKQEAVELYRRDTPAALLVSHSRFAVFVKALSERQNFDQQQRRILAWLITDQWLDGAAAHLREPQMAELERLTPEHLFTLFSIDPSQPKLNSLAKSGVDISLLERLDKRRKVAQAMLVAEEQGLYEVAEHATSEIDLEENDKDSEKHRR